MTNIDLNAAQTKSLQIYLSQLMVEIKKGIILFQSENQTLFVTTYLTDKNKSIVIKENGIVIPYYIEKDEQ